MPSSLQPIYSNRAPPTDVFVSMVSTHVVRGRSNLAAATIYLMRAIGMSAFQTSLLPELAPKAVHVLNQRALSVLLADTSLGTEREIQRALSVSETFTKAQGHRIHFAANLFEVMLNARAWNTAASTTDGGQAWGRRVVTFFVYDRQGKAFAPSKFCAFVPIHLGQAVSASTISMDLETYASLDELETRFDGNVAQRHLTIQLSMQPVPIDEAPPEVTSSFRTWHKRFAERITLHPRGPILLLAPPWWI